MDIYIPMRYRLQKPQPPQKARRPVRIVRPEKRFARREERDEQR